MKRRYISVIMAIMFALVFVFTACGGGGAGSSNNHKTARSWGTAEVIDDATAYSAGMPRVAFDAGGNAIAVWQQYDGAYYSIYANRYDARTDSWGAPGLIETEDTNAGAARVALDASGNAFAVWWQEDGPGTFSYDIYANRYDAGKGTWGTAELINTGVGSIYDPSVAVAASGNAIATWMQDDGSGTYTFDIYANHYVHGTGWTGAVMIDDTSAGGADVPEVAFDSSGNAIAVWQQNDGAYWRIYARRYVAGTGWTGMVVIDNDTGNGNASWPQVAFDAGGNAIAVWKKIDGANYRIYANHYDVNADSWGMVELVEADAGVAEFPQVAVDASGNAIAVWQQNDGAFVGIYTSRYNFLSDTWSTVELIEASDSNASFPQLASDANGNAIAVWMQEDMTSEGNNIYANHYDVKSDAWGTAELIESGDGNADQPYVAVDYSGTAFAVWSQFDGVSVYDVYANRFE